MVVFFLEKKPMTNKIEKFLYILEHLIPDGRDEIPTFALYLPLLPSRGLLRDYNLRMDLFEAQVVTLRLFQTRQRESHG